MTQCCRLFSVYANALIGLRLFCANKRYLLKGSLRKDKDRDITALCEDLEEANDKGNMRKMYQTVRSLTQKFQPQLHCRVKIMRDGNRTDIQIAARWNEYCEELFEDNNYSVNLPQSVHVQPQPPPLRSSTSHRCNSK